MKGGWFKPFKNAQASLSCAAILLTYVFVVFVSLDYNHSNLSKETPFWRYYILKTGTSLSLYDLTRSLNYWQLEIGYPRTSRPLASLFEVVDTKFRATLWHYIPPHPSLSLTWIFSLVLTPLLLYGFLRHQGIDRPRSRLATAIFLMSPGSITLISSLFRPAKPLMSFSLMLALYCAAILSRALQSQKKKQLRLEYCLFLTMMYCSLFWDETAVIIPVVVVMFFPNLLRDRFRFFAYLGFWFLALVTYMKGIGSLLMAVGYTVPATKDFYVTNNLMSLGFSGVVSKSLRRIILVVQESAGLFYPTTEFPFWENALRVGNCLLFAAALVQGVRYLRARRKNTKTKQMLGLLGLSLFSLLIFSVLTTILVLAANLHMEHVGICYYGAYMSIFAAVSLASLSQLFDKTKLSMPMLFGVLFVAVAWQSHPYPNFDMGFKNQYANCFVEEQKEYDGKPISETTKAIWTSLRDPAANPLRLIPKGRENLLYIPVEMGFHLSCI